MRQRLWRGDRIGCALGSSGTGVFGTVPGLLAGGLALPVAFMVSFERNAPT